MTEQASTGEKIAFVCFFASGCITLIIGTLNVVPLDRNSAATVGFFVAIPLAVVTMLLMAIAIFYSLFSHHHKGSMILSIITLLFAIEMMGEYGPPLLYNVSPLIYGITVILISAFCLIRSKKQTPY